jgi:hypothetical protein
MNERMDATTNSPFYHADRGFRSAENDVGKLLISQHDWILTTDSKPINPLILLCRSII